MNNSVQTSTVSVSVSVLVDIHGNPKVTCTPYTVNITDQNTTIAFTLVTSGWQFPSTNAVVVSSPNSDFPSGSTTVSATSATLLDYNMIAASFNYTAYVQSASTGATASVDPVIRNGGVQRGS